MPQTGKLPIKKMNIILALVIASGAVAVVLKYRPRGRSSRMLFALSLVFSFAMLFTTRDLSGVWAWIVTAVNIAAGSFGLLVFRSEARAQARARVKARALAKAACEKRAKQEPDFCPAERMRRVSLYWIPENSAA